MNAKTYILSIITLLHLLPITAYASNVMPLHISIIKKVTTLAHLEHIIPQATDSYLAYESPTTDNTKVESHISRSQEIIDTYSGIKININHPNVYFSYLGEELPPRKIEQADSQTFKLIETGTEIIAIDKNAVYLIYGDEQTRFPEIDTTEIKIIRKDLEDKYIKSKDKTYSIQGNTLVEITP